MMKFKSMMGLAAMGVVGSLGMTAQAAPLLNLVIEGRASNVDPWSSSLNVTPGQTIEYRARLAMASIGTSNTQGVTVRTISSINAGDGANGLKFDLIQPNGATVTIDFDAAGTLAAGWSGASGFSGGTVADAGPASAAPAVTGSEPDWLFNVRPVRTSGSFAVGDILSGSVDVVGGTGSSVLTGRWSAGGSGSFRINGSASNIFITATTEAGADPFVGYTPLNLTIAALDGDLTINKFLDLNADGDKDVGEGLLGAGYEFELRDALVNGNVVGTGTTDGSGTVTLTDIAAGTYYLFETDVPLNTLYGIPTSQGVQVTIVGGQTVSVNFGNIPEPASLGVLALGGLALLARRRK